ncbi:unannotated protein [freshwater metagenome]|uniref:Unannotated protein n=1 Tax=freshwater metagenome TaxID=449393 RepID=A0A6J7I8T3_9ZZZZ
MTMSESPKVRAVEINDTIRYTLWSVFSQGDALSVPSEAAERELAALVAKWASRDITLRGFYDVSGLRADADIMLWIHAVDAAVLQEAIREFRATAVGSALVPVWSGMGLHRPAEFNKGHVPEFMTGAAAQDWICVYPFVRSYEWYLLPEEERRAMLVEHGTMGREWDMVRSNTVAAFALGDYEWILALESPTLHDIVDLMRHLRYSSARRHVREEVPFFTGRLVDVAGAVNILV